MGQAEMYQPKWRKGTRNVIDVRWVYKWKLEKEALSAEASLERREVKQVKVVRARLRLTRI